MPHGEYKTPGGKLVVVDFELQDGRLTHVVVSGDFFLEPEEAIDWIAHALEGLPADNLTEEVVTTRIQQALPPDASLIGFSPEAVARAVRRALG